MKKKSYTYETAYRAAKKTPYLREFKTKILSLLLIGVIMLFSGCRTPENKVYPPFFKISDPNTGGVVYLLGTMHVGVSNTVYPDEIYDALDECSALAVEIDLQALEADMLRMNSAMGILECQSGTAADYFGEYHGEVKEFFQKKWIYSSNLEGYIPAVWSSMLSNQLASDCGYFSQYGTDRAMLSYAKEHSMEIIELETVEEQYQINADEPPELQVYSLVSSVRTDYELQKAQMKELYRAWSENDSAAIEKMLIDEGIPEELKDDYEQYYFAMYENRQKNMADFIAKSLENGEKVTVAVGAMHCYASPDILDFLEGKAVIEEIDFKD